MEIHPLWYLCLTIRIGLIFLIRFIYHYKKKYKKYISFVLFLIGSGFIYKGIFGSNNEIQINKVFWHETRYLHGIYYLTASFYIYKNNLHITSLILLMDILTSILYRII